MGGAFGCKICMHLTHFLCTPVIGFVIGTCLSVLCSTFLDDYGSAISILDLTPGSASWGEASFASDRICTC